MYVNSQGGRLGREEYLGFLRDGPVRWLEQRLDDVAVVETGPVAVLTATILDEVIVEGQRPRWQWVGTQTYVRSGEDWLYLAGHTALPH